MKFKLTEEAVIELDTDYDRENPILKGTALHQFIKQRTLNLDNFARRKTLKTLDSI